MYIMVILLFTGTVHSYYSWKVKTYLLWNVTLYSLILPTLALALIKRLRRLSSGTKRISRKEITIIALLVGGACFVTLAITMMKYPALAIFRKMALAGLFCEIFCLVALPFSRISYHLTAMGAAVATAISYTAVYAIRAYDTKYYVRFNMHTVRLAVDTLVLLLQISVMICSIRFWMYIQLALVCFMLVFNGKDIFLTAVTFGKKMFKKEEKN